MSHSPHDEHLAKRKVWTPDTHRGEDAFTHPSRGDRRLGGGHVAVGQTPEGAAAARIARAGTCQHV